jgi:hypothetical protein
MKVEQDKKAPVVMELGTPSRLRLSNPSARIVLALLFLISLNAVACYDSTLTVIFRLGRVARVFSVHLALACVAFAREFYEHLGRRLH